MTSKREREYARRRHDKYQARLVERAERSRRRRRQALVAGAAAAVVAVLLAVVLVRVLGGGDDPAVQADAAGAEATALPDDPATAAPVATDASPTGAPVPDACPEEGPGPNPDAPSFDEVPAPDEGRYRVTLATTCGDVVLDLDGSGAPQGVGNFVTLAREGYFDASPCHRLTTQGIFVLQCGDPTGTGTGGPGYSWGPIENAPGDDVYPAGTVAMARVGGDAESMGSQFFLVYEDSTIPSDAAGGYSVLGTVTQGLDIVTSVAAGGLGPDGVAPADTIGITSVSVEEAS